MSLWVYAKEKVEQTAARKAQSQEKDGQGDDEFQIREDSYILLFGGRSSGKTSLILRFLDKEEQAWPTIALEYTYGRRTKGNTKEVGHIWELGGGTRLVSLLDSVITPESIEQLSLVLMLDLSSPDSLWSTLETCLNSAKIRIGKLMESSRVLNEKLMRRAWTRLGPECQDKDLIKPFPIPVAIVGGKYDIFQDFHADKRKLITRALRFVAHLNGASLQVRFKELVSSDDLYTDLYTVLQLKNGHLSNPRTRIDQSLHFQHSRQVDFVTFIQSQKHMPVPICSKGLVTDHNKPLFIPAGADSIQEIGPPPAITSGHVSGSTATDIWKSAFCECYPQKSLKVDAIEDPAKDPQYKEEAIDLLRAQKDQELEKRVRQRGRDETMKEQNIE